MNDALLGSFISAMSTGLGAVPILFMRKISHRLRDILLAYAAGIMTSASVYNLIPEALGQSNMFVLAFGIMLGSLVLLILEMRIPHVDLENPEKMPFKIEGKAFMIIAAITMHNLPEGLSVGVSYASTDENLGNLIAFSIGLQNAPEGFLVALFLVNQNIGRFKALGIATLTGACRDYNSHDRIYTEQSGCWPRALRSCICGRRDDVYRLQRADSRESR